MTQIAMEAVDIAAAASEMTHDLLGRAGWLASRPLVEDGKLNVTFYRQESDYPLSPDETALRLGLMDNEGNAWPGNREAYDPVGRAQYGIDLEAGSDSVMVDYEGPHDARYKVFFEALLTLGHDLKAQRAADIAAVAGETQTLQDKDDLSPGAGPTVGAASLELAFLPLRATNKLLWQLEGDRREDGIIEQLVEEGISRAKAVAAVVGLVAGTFLETTDSGDEAILLAHWQRHVEHRYRELSKALGARGVAGNDTLEVLGSIQDGVRLAAEQSRPSQELLPEVPEGES